MQRVERAGGVLHLHLAGHEKILIEDIFDLLVLHAAALDQTGTDVQLQPASAGQRHLHILRSALEGALAHVVLAQQAQIGRLEQRGEGHVFHLQRPAGEDVDIAQADAFKIRRMVDLDKVRQHLVQPAGEVLPAGIGRCRQRHEAVGQIDLPAAVGTHKLKIDHIGLRLRTHALRRLRQLGRLLFHVAGIAGIVFPDPLLKIRGLRCADAQNGRKAKLADHLRKLRFGIVDVFTFHKHDASPHFVFSEL